MILLLQSSQEYNNDIRAMIMAFFPGVKITEDAGAFERSDEKERLFSVWAEYWEDVTRLSLYKAQTQQENSSNEPPVLTRNVPGDYRAKQTFRNKLKRAVYELLSDFTGRKLPWGDLTGVRPTKIAMSRLKAGDGIEEAISFYREEYGTSEEKARLAVSVAERERKLISLINAEKDYCLYVGIPFCPSRCLYCSFTSYPIALYQEKVRAYIDTLKQELAYIAEEYRQKRLVSVYIGGGTPTSISPEYLDELLTQIENLFDLSGLLEFTVEAGRPDSITREKLRVMKEHKVTRISINPQTMNDETLKTIGRAHTAKQTVDAFKMARQEGFDNINMDLIAGLPDEDMDCMRSTLDRIKELSPDSITVHSLAVKRAARLRTEMEEYGGKIQRDADQMLNLVFQTAEELSMQPYYLYRQKNIAGNLENVGYAGENKECLYNVLIMEEITDIIAAGAGASTKLVFPRENRVERIENCKSVDDYIERFDEMLARKKRWRKKDGDEEEAGDRHEGYIAEGNGDQGLLHRTD